MIASKEGSKYIGVMKCIFVCCYRKNHIKTENFLYILVRFVSLKMKKLIFFKQNNLSFYKNNLCFVSLSFSLKNNLYFVENNYYLIKKFRILTKIIHISVKLSFSLKEMHI